MALAWTQKDRLLSLETPLGADRLMLRSFSGREAISALFRFQLDLISEDGDIDFDKIVGQNVTFGVKLLDKTSERSFNGFVSRFVQLPGEQRLAHYQADVVPWLWFLTRTADCRIFQNMTVADIIQRVFRDLGFQDFESHLQGRYDPWEYCVQYRETAFNFVSRLMEQEGIFYFFRHETGKHVLVLADSPAAHKPCPGQARARFERHGGPGYKREEDTVFTWRLEQELRPGKYAVTDYNFETPATGLLANVDSSINQGGNQRFEIYDYPGEYEKRSEGDEWVRVRMEEEEAAHTVASGESNCRAFCAGGRFELAEYERRAYNGPYVLTAVTHSAEEGGFYSGAGSLTEATYQNLFTAIPYAVRFRPPRVTPKPLIQGAQTAVVTGPEGEEIYVDKYGRVKVQFHWDRVGEYNENSSCWIRVSQPWAGKNWGAMWIPRLGQEVIVDFLEGDPDRPLITGRVYNAVEMPPYALPGEQTKSAFKSYSSKGGGGFNEIRFEDKKGEEQVFIHGEKDLDVRIKNDRREWIGRDRHLVVKRDRVEKIERDAHSATTRDLIAQVGRDHHLKIDGKQAIKVAGSHSLSVDGKVIQQFGADASAVASGAFYIKGAKVVVEGATGLTIKCGSNFVTVDASGVSISGSMVKINSGGAALSASAGQPVKPAAPNDAEIADNADPGSAAPSFRSQRAAKTPAQTAAANAPSHDPKAEQNIEKKDWVEIELVDDAGKPVPGEPYRVTLPDGATLAEGTLDEKGFARVEHIDPGACKVTFPKRDKDSWKRK